MLIITVCNFEAYELRFNLCSLIVLINASTHSSLSDGDLKESIKYKTDFLIA